MTCLKPKYLSPIIVFPVTITISIPIFNFQLPELPINSGTYKQTTTPIPSSSPFFSDHFHLSNHVISLSIAPSSRVTCHFFLIYKYLFFTLAPNFPPYLPQYYTSILLTISQTSPYHPLNIDQPTLWLYPLFLITIYSNTLYSNPKLTIACQIEILKSPKYSSIWTSE